MNPPNNQLMDMVPATWLRNPRSLHHFLRETRRTFSGASFVI